MTEEEILARLREIMRDNAIEQYEWEEVGVDATIEDLGFDSLTILDLIYDIAQVFGVEIEASEVVDLRTVGEIVSLLQQRGV